mgnify:CR=1 FL=1
MATAFGFELPLLLTVLGFALVIAEAIAPGTHFIVPGVALLAAGLLGLALPAAADPLSSAVVVFAVGVSVLYVYRRFDFYGGKGVARTRDSGSLVGQRGRVTERVTPSHGQVELRDGGFDPTFSARTEDGEIDEGVEVVVVDAGGGSVLTVEPAYAMDEGDLADELLSEDETGSDANT